jgi:hypothetical protein
VIRRFIRTIGAAALLAITGAPAAAKLPRFHGHVAGVATGSGRTFYEGDGLYLVFTDSYRSNTRYRVCWSTTAGTRRRCWTDRTGHYGHRRRVFVSAPLTGGYIARWYVNGRVVDSWSFTIAGGD